VTFPLEKADEALSALRAGEIQGAAVLVVDCDPTSSDPKTSAPGD